MTRRILPPNPADVLRSHHERLERLERLLQQPPEPDPLPPAGGEGGSCTHIWGQRASLDDGWEARFGSWVGAFGMEVDIPAAGQVQVSGSVNFEEFAGFDTVRLSPWCSEWPNLEPSVVVAEGGSGSIVWTFVADPGVVKFGYAVRVGPNSLPAPPDWMELPVNIVWSECGHGETAYVAL